MKRQHNQSVKSCIEETSDETWVSDRQLAERLGVSRASIWRYVSRGLIPEPDRFGGVTRFRLNASITSLLERQ